MFRLQKKKRIMAVHNLQATPMPLETLNLSWIIVSTLKPLHAISIELSSSPEFKTSQHYVLPPTAPGCSLDVGNGSWFFRAGSWIGEPGKGVIEWSGIYGPVQVISKKPSPKEPQTPFILQYVRSLHNGVRVHYLTKESFPKLYAVFQVWKGTDPNKIKTMYIYDSIPEGKYELMGLEQEYEVQFRFACLGKSFPSNSIISLTGWTNGRGKPLGKGFIQTEAKNRIASIEDSLLVKSAKEKNQRFESHTDYIKYLQAKARIG